MTYGEEKMLCSCVSIMILVLAVGIFIGLKIPKKIFEEREPVKDEQWFVKEAAEIYTLAMEWYDPDGEPHREARRKIERTVGAYNAEAEKIKRWTYRCPPRFTLEYLGIGETE